MTTAPWSRTTDAEATARTLAQARYRWHLLNTVPLSWTETDRRRTLAAAFLDLHAAKLALTETARSGG